MINKEKKRSLEARADAFSRLKSDFGRENSEIKLHYWNMFSRLFSDSERD